MVLIIDGVSGSDLRLKIQIVQMLLSSRLQSVLDILVAAQANLPQSDNFRPLWTKHNGVGFRRQ